MKFTNWHRTSRKKGKDVDPGGEAWAEGTGEGGIKEDRNFYGKSPHFQEGSEVGNDPIGDPRGKLFLRKASQSQPVK